MASYKEFEANKVSRYLGIAFTGIGAIMLIVFIGVAIRTLTVTSSYEKINSTICDITYTKNNDGGSQTKVTVAYEFDGATYQQVLPSADSSMRVGQNVAIYVDPDDPTNIQTMEFYVVMLAVFGGLGAVFGTIGVIISIKSKDYRKQLIDEGRGEPVYATVTYAGKSSVEVNSQSTYHVKANWTDEYGAAHEFKSRLTYTDPNMYINEGDEIQVYIDPKNYKHYHVCLEELEEKFIQSEAGNIQ